MRYIVYGIGAIGGVIAGRLHEGGHEVVGIARGAHYETTRREGLRVESPDGNATVPLEVVDHPREIAFSSDDVVILAMKSQDTTGALADLADAAPPEVAVVCAQNGVENERLALRRFPNVYGMVVWCPGVHLEPGIVQVFGTPKAGVLDLGRYPSGGDEVAEGVAEALEASTFSSRADPEIMRWKYAKLLTNLGNAVEALCGREARSGDLARLARDEGVACLEAAGIDVASEDEFMERIADHLKLRPIDGQRRGGGSSWQSLERGAGTIEADFLNGEIVLLGRLHGVPTPANAFLQQLANEAARKGRPAASMSPDELLDQLPVG